MPSGNYFIDPVLANASKIHEGKGNGRGDAADDRHRRRLCRGPALGPGFRQPRDRPAPEEIPQGGQRVPVENRVKMFRLVEKMAMESADTISDIHGGGSPAAHRLTIFRESNTKDRIRRPKNWRALKSDSHWLFRQRVPRCIPAVLQGFTFIRGYGMGLPEVVFKRIRTAGGMHDGNGSPSLGILHRTGRSSTKHHRSY